MDERSRENGSEECRGTNDIEDTVTEQKPETSIGTENAQEDELRIISEEAFAAEEEIRKRIMEKERENKRRRNSVPLVAYVASLLAVLLVMGMFTFAFSLAAHRQGYYEGLSDKLSPNGGIGEDLFESLFGDLLGSPSDSSDFAALERLHWIFENYGYETFGDVDFLTAVMDAYVDASGDMYAEYYTEEEYLDLIAESQGEGVGIGVQVVYSAIEYAGAEYHVLEILTAFPNTPAINAGILPGDLVFSVGSGEGRALVEELGYTESVYRLRGEKGTAAEFTVLRPKSDGSYEEIPFSIVRDEYETQSVEYKVSETDASVGIVRILQFDLTTPTQLEKAMDALLASGIKRIVFDLRSNPGGDLRSICAVLSFFLEENDLIISTKTRDNLTTEYRAGVVSYEGSYEGCSVEKSDIGKYRGYDYAVLTNGSTASAAELFTAAFRDYELATLVGTKTYGKGSVQSIIPMENYGFKDMGAIRLTTYHYFPPCGEGYHGIGITPDVEIELSEEAQNTNIYKLAEADDNQLQAAIDALVDKAE